jgi:Uncharacterised protein family (UPF0158)
MPIPVPLQDVVDEMDSLTDEATAYLNRGTGELYTIRVDELDLVEHEDDPGDLPDWQRETLSKAREIVDSEDWLPLPNKFDIHEYAIMQEFCLSVDNPRLKDELLNAIRGSGAFRYFRDTIRRHAIQEAWYQYRHDAFEKKAIEWLEENGIAYKRGG